jgi:hypothetical protein
MQQLVAGFDLLQMLYLLWLPIRMEAAVDPTPNSMPSTVTVNPEEHSRDKEMFFVTLLS